MSAGLYRVALEVEADRLSGVFLRVRLLVQARRTDLETAGREAVAQELVSPSDWELVREAVGRR